MSSIKQLDLDLPIAPESEKFTDAHDAHLSVELVPGALDQIEALLCAVYTLAQEEGSDGWDMKQLSGLCLDHLRDLQNATRVLERYLARVAARRKANAA